MENKVLLNVDGMSCTNCALTVTKVLEKDGFKDVYVNFATGEVTFEKSTAVHHEQAVKNINSLGYRVISDGTGKNKTENNHDPVFSSTSTILSVDKKFYWSLLFTVPLLAHMFLPFHFLHDPIVQLMLSIPVVAIGVQHFGRSAWLSVKSGVPNMDVLIAIGSGSAFIYSLYGMIIHFGTPEVNKYLFFETAAAIITFVLLGNVIEKRSVRQTTTAISELSKLQAAKAKKIIFSDTGNEQTVELSIDKIEKGDWLLVNSGDVIPLDGKIVWGQAAINESMITGEGLPVNKKTGDEVIGSTIIESGSFKMMVERTGDETTLAKIIELVSKAQNTKPVIQKLGDKVSAVFVPVVVAIALLTFIVSFLVAHLSIQQSLMHSIAVLVISCPCAMGLATPTAVMVGIGRAAKNGILIKGGITLESFAKVKTIVFDKTGTLTTGNFKIKKIHVFDGDEETIRTVLYAMEKHSSHPIAKSILSECREAAVKSEEIDWEEIEEDKGIGIRARTKQGDQYGLGSFQLVKHLSIDSSHNLYLLKNNQLLAAVDLEDEIKHDAIELIRQLKKQGIKTVMVSGDRKAICEAVSENLGIDETHSEQMPAQKLEIIEQLSKESITAMVGDGINDAPALARASVGISISDASHVAIQSAQIILLHGNNLLSLLKAIQISKHTLVTIRQNLFWAFFYNVVAIPIAAFGMLSPMIGAFSMAFSDVVVIGNSIRLKSKNIS